MPTVRALKPGDIEHIAEHMRESDRLETFASCGMDPFDVLIRSVSLSDPDLMWTIEDDGEPVAVFGAAPGSEFGIPWLLATDGFTRDHDFVKSFPKPYIKKMQEKYGVLFNFVHAKNIRSIRWLKQCGFTVHQPQPMGRQSEPFCSFILGGKHV